LLVDLAGSERAADT
jgi:hypothetical protein